MSRPTRIIINTQALLHNVSKVRSYAPSSKVIAIVKANAYGHDLNTVCEVLKDEVEAFGVACLEEAQAIRELNINTDIILMEGVFSALELDIARELNLQVAINNFDQLDMLLNNRARGYIKAWIKCDTGMHRLGFETSEVPRVYEILQDCEFIDADLNLMTHFASANELDNQATPRQMELFFQMSKQYPESKLSLANSAAIIGWPDARADFVRPGIMLYGISPFDDKIGADFGLQPVMSLVSQIIAMRKVNKGERVGYGGAWQAPADATIGVVAIGYGDGYPRHIRANTPVMIGRQLAPIVGQVSMDLSIIDLSQIPDAKVGDAVELWGDNLPIEQIAACANTIPYELTCQLSSRIR